MKKRVAVLFGGPSSESEISRRSADNVTAALLRKGYDAKMVELDQSVMNSLEQGAFEVVYLITHGNPGEDGSIQGLLELRGLPYTYSGILSSALALDKRMTKIVLRAAGVPVLEDILVEQEDIENKLEIIRKLPFPVILKPNKEGSSVGITVLQSFSEVETPLRKSVERFGQMLVEPFIIGREITVGILEKSGQELLALPIIELRPKNAFYDFEAKYTQGMTDFICPADFPAEVAAKISEASCSAFRSLGCSGAARVDFMVRNDEFWALEVNTIPGMTSTSDLPMAAAAAGIGFDDLVVKILDQASLKR